MVENGRFGNNNNYCLYSIEEYKQGNTKFIKNNGEYFDDLKKVIEKIKNDNGYHFRIHKRFQYIFFGDLDHYNKKIEIFIKKLQNFLEKYYGIYFDVNEFKYTKNNIKDGSYHYSIPKWNASTEKLKEVNLHFLKINKEDFTYIDDNGEKSHMVDTTIYSEHWFRCPNQKKGNEKSQHIIMNGQSEDFVIEHIPDMSININNIKQIDEENKNKKELIENCDIIPDKEDIIIPIDTDHNNIIKKVGQEIVIYKDNKELTLSMTMNQPIIYKKMFDNCYKQERFDVYDNWIAVCMAIRNTFFDDKIAFDLFDYFSSKGIKYEGTKKTEMKFNTFIKMTENKKNKYTAATIYYYAIEDNKPKFLEIMKKNNIELEQYDMCMYVKMLAGKYFIYAKFNNIYKLFCFNGKIWKTDDTIFKQYLSTELYEFLKIILTELYFEHKLFGKMVTQINKLKTANFKQDIVKTYKEVNCDDHIKFDDKWYLFGFDNIVYDLKEDTFREYKYDDYIAVTTGYDWREPTTTEINTINELIDKVMPIKEEKELYLQGLSTGLDGRCLEKLLIFNGNGGNGKGMIDDLIYVALGNYGFIGNNSILFEASKTGSNPEKANIHKKRFVIFREPPENKKFENSIIKELTGGGFFSARGHHETETKKELNLTMIVECNKKPLFSEEPTEGDVRRIIDIYFRSTFTQDKNLLDDKNHVYEANTFYKTDEFKEQHKFAIIKILMNAYKRYRNNNYVLQVPKSIQERTKLYLEMSCNIVQWFKDNYDLTKNKKDICKMIDLYHDFSHSMYFTNLTKNQKLKYNKKYFNEYVTTNSFFKQYHEERYDNIRNCITCWKKIEADDND